jgi:UDP-glucose 4-epimerase
MKCIVTGGAGFIGSHTVDALLACGAEITVYDRVPSNEAHNLDHVRDAITYITGDIRDYETLATAMNGHTHVVHLAAAVSVPESTKDPRYAHDVNVTGTSNMFEAARMSDVSRVVYASSAAVYGTPDTIPIREDMPLSPRSPYGLHKHVNEQYASIYTELYGMKCMGLRYFNVYGSRQHHDSPYSGVISIFMHHIRNGLPLTMHGDGSTTRDFIHVYDVARANVRALHSTVSSVFNIGTGCETTLTNLVDTIEHITEMHCDRVYAPTRSGDIKRSCAFVENSARLLGYESSISLNDGLRELYTHTH